MTMYLSLLNFVITFVLFSYMFTHALEQVKPMYWLVVILISIVSVVAFVIAKNKKWLTLIVCNSPMLVYIFAFMLPVNLNQGFITNFCLPYLLMIIVQLAICKWVQTSRALSV